MHRAAPLSVVSMSSDVLWQATPEGLKAALAEFLGSVHSFEAELDSDVTSRARALAGEIDEVIGGASEEK